MIPLLDAFNHKPGSTLRQYVDGEMKLVATEAIQEGSEVSCTCFVMNESFPHVVASIPYHNC